MAIDRQTFGLKHKRACISGRKNKNKYMDYQNDYRAQYGVFPELDRIHRPFRAHWDEVYDTCCVLRKSGLYGALYFHDLHNRFRKRLKRIYENYLDEWSFMVSVNLENRTLMNDVITLDPGEHIENNLGYRKTSEGNYYEGTWENGRLIYGFVYISEQNLYYAGSFDETGRSNCHGVAITLITSPKGKQQVETVVGEFRYQKERLSSYESNCLTMVVKAKDERLTFCGASIGKFEDGYANGTFIEKEYDNDSIRINWVKYRDGDVKSEMSALIEGLPRILMMFYMLIWYLVKYVYGSAFFITPLYYIIRRKQWRI